MASAKNNKGLSNRAIETMKPKQKFLSDIGENRGLRVNCGKTGRKSFSYRFRSPIDSSLREMKLGTYPDMSLEEARIALRKLKDIRNAGRCPKEEIKAKEQMRRDEERQNLIAQITVQEIVEDYLTQRIEDRYADNGKFIAGSRKPKGQAEVRRTLYRDAVRVLGHLPAVSINSLQITDLIGEIINRGARVQAGNVLRELSAAYENAIGTGLLPVDLNNPAIQAKAGLKRAGRKLTCKKGKRVLDDQELSSFLRWLPTSKFSENHKNILMFTLWTGCRTGEICKAKWSDIDFEKGYFKIKDAKNGTSRNVQLSRQAIEWLEEHQLKSKNQFLFPSQVTKKHIQQKQLTEQAWRMRNNGQMLSIEPWTPHDLRRTVRTGLSRLRCPSEVAEAVLGHSAIGVVGTYDLHGYELECKEWLQIWAEHMDKLLTS